MLAIAALAVALTRTTEPTRSLPLSVNPSEDSTDLGPILAKAPGVRTETTSGRDFAYTPVFEEQRCLFDLPPGRNPTCGWLIVPENRSVENSREVQIHVAIFKSDSPSSSSGPILFLDGGPGGETLSTLWFSFDEVWAPLLRHGDLIFFDQRGIGYSQPSLKCPETLEVILDLIDEDVPSAERLSREYEAITKCHSRLVEKGVDLAAYNSSASAADVDDLRIALGYQDWNLLGISYGTRLALTVLRDYPAGVRTVVLDSVYPLEANLMIEAPKNLDRAFDALFTACQIDQACNDAYPELRSRVFALVKKLDIAPITVDVGHLLTGKRYAAVLTGTNLLSVIFDALYAQEWLSQIPEMVAELERGETEVASALISLVVTQTDFFSVGMHLSTQCHEEIPFASEEEIAAGLTGFEEFRNFFAESLNLSTQMLRICEAWDVGSAPPIENLAISSSTPALVLAGHFDPITPPQWGRNVAATLENSFYVEVPTLGHGVSLADECTTEITLDFLTDPATQPETGCIEVMREIAFVTPPFDPNTLTLQMFTEDFPNVTISGVVPQGWSRIDIGPLDEREPGVVWGRLSTPSDLTTLWYLVAPASEFSVEDFLSGLEQGIDSGLSVESGFELEREIASPAGAWKIHVGSFGSYLVDVAAHESGVTVAIVMLIARQDERNALVDAVLLPALFAMSASRT